MEYIYGALLLHKLGKAVDEDGLKAVVAATGAQVDESKIKTLVVSLKGVDIDNELATASIASAAPAAVAVEEKKEAPKEKKEEAAEGLSALFG